MRAALLLAFAVACSSSPADRPIEIGGPDRPTDIKVPAHVDSGKQFPLLVVLHGYGASGFVQSAFFGVSAFAAMDEAFLLAPDGLVDSTGAQYWNADPACCDYDHSGVDDVAYIGGLIDRLLASDWPIDPKQVYVIGHSNGGFMTYRMACDRSDVIAAAGVLAGLYPTLPCNPTRPMSLLHMHGTADTEVLYEDNGVGAEESVAAWAHLAGCGTTRTTRGMLDLDAKLAGAETTDSAVDGCPSGITVELWSIAGGAHLPSFTDSFTPTMWQWLQDHATP